jgi:hypothetical protein
VRGIRRFRPLLFASFLLLVACSAPAPKPVSVPPSHPGITYEEPLLPPPGELRLEIATLDELPGPDEGSVTLHGLLKNGGERATSRLRVTIDALDAAGSVVLSAEAIPASERVVPKGTVPFTATVERRPEVVRYRVEAIGR